MASDLAPRSTSSLSALSSSRKSSSVSRMTPKASLSAESMKASRGRTNDKGKKNKMGSTEEGSENEKQHQAEKATNSSTAPTPSRATSTFSTQNHTKRKAQTIELTSDSSDGESVKAVPKRKKIKWIVISSSSSSSSSSSETGRKMSVNKSKESQGPQLSAKQAERRRQRSFSVQIIKCTKSLSSKETEVPQVSAKQVEQRRQHDSSVEFFSDTKSSFDPKKPPQRNEVSPNKLRLTGSRTPIPRSPSSRSSSPSASEPGESGESDSSSRSSDFGSTTIRPSRILDPQIVKSRQAKASASRGIALNIQADEMAQRMIDKQLARDKQKEKERQRRRSEDDMIRRIGILRRAEEAKAKQRAAIAEEAEDALEADDEHRSEGEVDHGEESSDEDEVAVVGGEGQAGELADLSGSGDEDKPESGEMAVEEAETITPMSTTPNLGSPFKVALQKLKAKRAAKVALSGKTGKFGSWQSREKRPPPTPVPTPPRSRSPSPTNLVNELEGMTLEDILVKKGKGRRGDLKCHGLYFDADEETQRFLSKQYDVIRGKPLPAPDDESSTPSIPQDSDHYWEEESDFEEAMMQEKEVEEAETLVA